MSAAGPIALLLFAVLIFAGVPIAFSMLLVGFLGLAQVIGWAPALASAKTIMYHAVSNWLYVCVPMFILMGHFASQSGIVKDIFRFFQVWFWRLPGALAIVTISSSAIFAFATGSSLASTAVLGKITLPEMDQHGYSRRLSLGTIVAGGSLGAFIPPSIALVMYGIVADQSIGRLLLAAVVPGLIVTSLFVAMILILVWRKPQLVAGGPPTRPTRQELLSSFKDVWGMLLLVLIVLGSIFLGIATVTEAAAVGAFGSFLIVLFRRKFTWKGFWEVLNDTGKTTAMLTFLVACVSLFSRFLSFSGFTRGLAEAVTGTHNVPTPVILVAIYGVFLIAGCMMDGTSMLLVLTPILLPIVTKLGFDPVWWGVITVAMIEIGFLTPPVGLCVYVLRGVSGASLEEIFSSIYPFLAVWLLCIALFTAYPGIVLFLPRLMFAR